MTPLATEEKEAVGGRGGRRVSDRGDVGDDRHRRDSDREKGKGKKMSWEKKRDVFCPKKSELYYGEGNLQGKGNCGG